MSVLRFDCRFCYHAGFALDLTFVAERGVTALVGPSGSGKTTVLNLIAGLLTPNDGVITLADGLLFSSRDGINLPPERRGVGYIFQDYQLFPHLSVAQNLAYGQRRAARGGASFDRVVATLELAELLNRAPASLSGGQKQRVAIGRALLCSPRLLLLDEPLNALDADLRQNIATFVGRVIAEFQIPGLLVSHDKESVAALADDVVTLPRV
jgi:molybdate transport system ATP-binding protein